jgi:hypothetical protein
MSVVSLDCQLDDGNQPSSAVGIGLKDEKLGSSPALLLSQDK